MGQCSATMMAAQCFNAQAGTGLTTLYGTVTTGNVWKFLKLEGNTLFIDLPEYYIGGTGSVLWERFCLLQSSLMPFESGKFPAQIAAFLVGLKRLRELLGW
jgi:hypothetical protein